MVALSKDLRLLEVKHNLQQHVLGFDTIEADKELEQLGFFATTMETYKLHNELSTMKARA